MHPSTPTGDYSFAWRKKEPLTADGKRVMSKDYFKYLLKSDHKLYYTTESLNEVLYLHFKGFTKIENLDLFPNLRCVYLENNGFSEIEGLESSTQMRSLYLHENLIKSISGLDALEELVVLNLSDNCIEKIEGLDQNKKLETLLLKRNRIGQNGPSDYEYLRTLQSVSVLDLSNNKVDHENPEEFIKILEDMKVLAVLYLSGNPIIKKIANYRKTLVSRLPGLRFLDDRPVFPDERRYAEAFARGGLEAEREERAKVKAEEEQKQRDQHLAFEEFMRRAREEREEKERLAALERRQNGDDQSQSSREASVDPNALDTYYTSSKDDSSAQKEEESSSLNHSQSVDRQSKSSRSNNQPEETSERSKSRSSSASGDRNELSSQEIDKDSTPADQDDDKVPDLEQPPEETTKLDFAAYMSELD